MDYDLIRKKARAERLDVYGGFHPGPQDNAAEGTGTILMLGPSEPGFWAHSQTTPEFRDGSPDPLDRWSARVIERLAKKCGATALFPFGGPPYQPFIAWAKRTRRAWQSPAGMLVHDVAGLMVSYRGALALPERLNLPVVGPNPCETCIPKPCLIACPVAALSREAGYDIAACHGFLNQRGGEDCMDSGCRARRACPVSESYGRVVAQSAFHMKAFHP